MGLFVNILGQVLVSLPFLYLIFFWKKTKITLKMIIIITFLLTLPSFWTVIKYETPLKHPVYEELDLNINQSYKTYEFEIYPMVNYDFVGLEVTNLIPEKNQNFTSWPNNPEDIEITIENALTENEYDPQHYNLHKTSDQKYESSKYGKRIEIDKLLKKTKMTYKINKNPPETVKSVILTLELSGELDYYSYHILSVYFNFVLVYGSLVLYFCIIWFIFLFKRSKKDS